MGPLEGLKIVEFGGMGPGTFCAQMLADMGADIIRLDRKVGRPRILSGKMEKMLQAKYFNLHRSRRSVAMNLKNPKGVEAVLKLIGKADALIEGFRPGVMEELGLGPDVCLERNPGLVYARITGWGQDGPLAHSAGHDINYIALTGALHAIGPQGQNPVPPLTLAGDFGGGGMLLAFGILCALHERQKSGKGQVVDASILDGCAALMNVFYGWISQETWIDKRASNVVDGGAHFYGTYETADGKYICIGSIEPQFYKLLLEKTGVADPAFLDQMNREKWPELKEKLVQVFKTKTQKEWSEVMEGSDVCFAPVLSLEEAPKHPHNVARKTFVEHDGVLQTAPAPRFSRTKAELQRPPPQPGEHTESALHDWGFSPAEIEALKASEAT